MSNKMSNDEAQAPVQEANPTNIPVQQQFFDQLLKDDDIEWKSLILEAVRSNQMDPWDIELSFIATQFLKMVREYQKMNFKLSGKVILAAALLLKLKSHRFVNHDINALDALIASTENEVDDDIIHDEPFDKDAYRRGLLDEVAEGQPQLYPRTPQPRKRKVSVYDLIKALEQALEVNKRREMRVLGSVGPGISMPKKMFDITQGLNTVYRAVATHYVNNGKYSQLTFLKLVPSEERNDKVFTFIPLLHLRNMQKVDMDQQEHFGDFSVVLTHTDPQAALTEELHITVEKPSEPIFSENKEQQNDNEEKSDSEPVSVEVPAKSEEIEQEESANVKSAKKKRSKKAPAEPSTETLSNVAANPEDK